MNWLARLFAGSTSKGEVSLVSYKSEIIDGIRFSIPEPTRSLVWVTDENPEKATDLGGTTIRVVFSMGSASTEENKDIYREPSLIWTLLPVRSNDRLEESPLYYPSYTSLTSEQRFQYITWLSDITKPTNLSYVFLYYYGLERHLLIGDYDKAVEEILRLIKFHDHDKFRFYVITPLIVASLYKKRIDLLDRAPFLLKEVTNEALIMRCLKRTPLNADDLIGMSSKVGFANKRYIKLEPELFKSLLQKNIDKEERRRGPILDRFDVTKLASEERSVFCNMSIPDKASMIKIPQLLTDKKFQEIILGLLSETHSEIRVSKGLTSKPQIARKKKRKNSRKEKKI